MYHVEPGCSGEAKDIQPLNFFFPLVLIVTLFNLGKKADSNKHLQESVLVHCLSLQVGRLLL